MLKNKPIIVLGMHRSGTSCLAGSLQDAGVFFGDVSVENKYNKKGNRENIEVMSLNEDILSSNGGSWDNPPREINWTKEHELRGAEIIKTFEANCHSNRWGFKDPRTVITFQFWHKLLPSYDLVGTIRSPYSVALSLNNRDKHFTIDKGLELWLKYNQTLLDIINMVHFPLISFDLPNMEYQSKLASIKKELSLANSTNSTTFFDKDLRSHSERNYQYNNEVNSCYSELKKHLL